jgi:ABC-2 type transport system ATP-binding protein
MSILTSEHLCRSFGDLKAVDDFCICVEKGEVFGLLGPNGAGKTTVIKMVTTLLPPSGGRASVGGFDVVRNAGDVRRLIGYVPQMLSADGTLTGRENLMIFAKLYDIPKTERATRVEESLKFMDLEDAGDKLVRNYSGGMIRRLEIAQSMLHRPRLLFLDEPTIGLDPVGRRAVWEHILRLRAEYCTTIFLTTHYMEEADNLCSTVAIMHLGKLAVIGPPSDLKASLSMENATLDDVFTHYTGHTLDSGGSFRDARSTRRTARRLG